MAEVYLSIGSNIERERHLRAARSGLQGQFGPLTLSSVYETRAVGFTGDDFYNLVVGFETHQDVHTVTDILRATEAACGRERGSQRFAPRTLDIDLLLYDALVIDEPGLRLPRDEIERYAFVLAPLAEIAGQLRHPLSGRSYADLWRDFTGDRSGLRIVDFAW